jgi:hypothetical protein
MPPPTPSPSPKITWVRRNTYGDTAPTELISKREKQFRQIFDPSNSLENDDSDKENIPPILETTTGAIVV